MHEQGLAAAVVETVLRHVPEGAAIRLLVRGGHTEPAAFDSALRAHLAADSRWPAGDVEILHAPVSAMCAKCVQPFLASTTGQLCPLCGGPPLPLPALEEIEVEIIDAPAHGAA